MTYFGLSSSNAVSTLFKTSSSTYNLLSSISEYNNYKTLNSVITSLKSDIASYSSDDDKTDLEDQLDTIRDTIKKHAPTSMTETITEMARENASSLLSSLGLGTTINTTI